MRVCMVYVCVRVLLVSTDSGCECWCGYNKELKVPSHIQQKDGTWLLAVRNYLQLFKKTHTCFMHPS
jgi:hypothetical protein